MDGLSESQQIAAVKNDGFTIKHIENPTEEVKLAQDIISETINELEMLFHKKQKKLR